MERKLIGNIIFELLTYMAQKEREKIKQRQREGIDAAKALGKHLGRPKAKYPDNWDEIYPKWEKRRNKSYRSNGINGIKEEYIL